MNFHSRVDNGIVYLSLEVQLCTDSFMTCLQTVELFNEIPLQSAGSSLRIEKGIIFSHDNSTYGIFTLPRVVLNLRVLLLTKLNGKDE